MNEEQKERAAKFAAVHLKNIMQAAEEGSAEDQVLLGTYYKKGEFGLTQDFDEAVRWFKKAAEQGDAYALFDLAMCYADGLGVKKNWEQAKHYFTEAALAVGSYEDDVTLNSRDAIRRLSESVYNPLTFFSIEFYKSLPKRRTIYDIDAVRELPSWDYEKYLTVPQDCAEAIKQFKKDAERGDAYALLRLGLCYADGLGVDKDWERAKKYFAGAVLADSKGDDILTLDAKEAYKILFERDCDSVDSFADELRKDLVEMRLIYQGK